MHGRFYLLDLLRKSALAVVVMAHEIRGQEAITDSSLMATPAHIGPVSQCLIGFASHLLAQSTLVSCALSVVLVKCFAHFLWLDPRAQGERPSENSSCSILA